MKRQTANTQLEPFVIILMVIGILASSHRPCDAQHITGTYTTSAPEATMFFLNPGYLNPAFGSGALGMYSNPAGLHVVKGNRLSFAYGSSQSSTGQLSFQALDETDFYKPITLDTQFEIKETGGLGAVGFAHQSGNWVWGIAMMQARKGGVSLQAQGSLDLTASFEYDIPITRELYSDLPVEEIPVTWNVDTRGTLEFSSTPAELYLSIQPIMGGFSWQKGHFSLGAGLTYFQLKSSNDTGAIYSQVDGSATITGTPHGIDPKTGLAWHGILGATVNIQDQPLVATYNFDISGQRFAFTVGGMMNYKPLSLGISYTHGFKSTITGSYDITTITTVDLPDKDILSDVELDLELQPELRGHASLTLRDFKKDTLVTKDSGSLNIGGYHAVSVGLHFLIFGAFVGAEVPQTYPDIYSGYFGLYMDFPLPKLPVRFNAGFITRSDGVMNETDFNIPFRVVSHVGAGLAFRLPTHEWFHFGHEHSWLRFGVRSSLTSYAVEILKAEMTETDNEKIPPAFESIAWSIGLSLPF